MAYKQLKLWFDKDLAILLADKLSPLSKLDKSAFISTIDSGVKTLELKDRVEHIADTINKNLIGSFKDKAQVLERILGPENLEETGMFKNFYWIMPIAKFVEKYGIEDFETSMHMIKEVTKRNTGEYAIRPFLVKYPKQTLEALLTWSKDSNLHIRRLSSEGPRPRLPWANKLQIFIDNPSPLFPIIESLKDDPSKYVQKSVANCINDILKDNPSMIKPILERWKTDASKERKWIIKHALRNFIKKDDKWALDMIA